VTLFDPHNFGWKALSIHITQMVEEATEKPSQVFQVYGASKQ
jgi:hypothetical protein